MGKYEIKGGLRVNLAAKLKKLLSCPIHNRNVTRMSKESFIRICLAVQDGKRGYRIHPNSAGELRAPDNMTCSICKVGEKVRSGTLVSEPKYLSWIPEHEEKAIRERDYSARHHVSSGYKEAAYYSVSSTLGHFGME